MPRRRRASSAMIMAGGKGERLHPLTRERSKPSVPFGGRYRIVDFVLSNFVNSEMLVALRARAVQVAVADRAPAPGLADHRHPARLLRHRRAAPDALRPGLVPRHRRRRAPEPERGRRLQPRRRGRLRRRPHLPDGRQPDAGLPPGVGRRRHGRRAPGAAGGGLAVRRARRRPAAAGWWPSTRSRRSPRRMPDDPERALVSMGNYIFSRQPLVDALLADARRSHRPRLRPLDHPRDGAHRPRLRLRLPGQRGPGRQAVRGAGLLARRGHGRRRTGTPTWTCSASRRASTSTTGYWPIRTGQHPGPARPLHRGRRRQRARSASRSLVKRATIRNSILGRSVWVNEGAVIEDSIVMDHTTVGKGARLRRAIVDRFNIIPADSEIGVRPGASTGAGTTSTPRASSSCREAAAASSCSGWRSSRGHGVSSARVDRHPRPLLPAAAREPLARGRRGPGLGRARTTTGTSASPPSATRPTPPPAASTRPTASSTSSTTSSASRSTSGPRCSPGWPAQAPAVHAQDRGGRPRQRRRARRPRQRHRPGLQPHDHAARLPARQGHPGALGPRRLPAALRPRAGRACGCPRRPSTTRRWRCWPRPA